MASKVCPVCKTFSSSSNTTLNAHIDRCLSDESTIKCKSDSKVIKHKIKPRKTRLMVDIYETAPHWTLEDLDRRNGTNWASNLECPAEALVVSAEEKNMTHSVDIHDNKESSAYIDSNSRKLRVLSKFSDSLANLNAKDDRRSRKLNEKGDGSKFLSDKKKNYLVQKHNLLKFRSHGQKSLYHRLDRCLKASDGQQREFSLEEGYKNEDPTKHLKKYDQMKSNDFGLIKQWVGSKQTGVKKKMNLKCKNQHWENTSNLIPVGDMYAKRINDSNSLILRNSQDECEGQPCLGKTVGSSLLGSQDLYVNKPEMFSNCKVKQLGKDVPFVCDMNPSSSTENTPRSSKRTGGNTRAIGDLGGPFIRTRMPQDRVFSSRGKKFASPIKKSLDRGIPPGSKKFSSSKKNRLSVQHTSVPESKKNREMKHLDFKKRKLQYMSGSDVRHETQCDFSEDMIESHSLSCQDLQYFRRPTTTSYPLPSQEKETGGGTENKFSSFNLRSESIPAEKPTPEPRKNITSSPMEHSPALVSFSSEAKFPTSGNCVPSPSTSTFVLRLMGKNLIVTNYDDNCLLKLGLSS